MKFQITSNYRPNTPHLREIKILVDDEIVASSFMTQDDIWKFPRILRIYHNEFMKLANSIED
jgi:hypothetical protein